MSKSIWRLTALFLILGSFTFSIGYFLGRMMGTNTTIERIMALQEEEKARISPIISAPVPEWLQ